MSIHLFHFSVNIHLMHIIKGRIIIIVLIVVVTIIKVPFTVHNFTPQNAHTDIFLCFSIMQYMKKYIPSKIGTCQSSYKVSFIV